MLSNDIVAKKQILIKINKEFDEYLRCEDMIKITEVPLGIQNIFNEIKISKKKQIQTLNSLKEQMQSLTPQVNEQDQQKFNQLVKQLDHKNNAIESQLEMENQLHNQCNTVQTQLRVLQKETKPLFGLEGRQDRNLTLSQDHLSKIDGLDVFCVTSGQKQMQSRVFRSKQEINSIEQQQILYFQHKKQIVDKRMNEKLQLRQQYVEFLYTIQKLENIESQQQIDMNQLCDDEKNIIARYEEKKAIFHSGYTLVKVRDLCQSPNIFEDYFELVVEQSPNFSLDYSSDEGSLDDSVRSLFATAVKIRRKKFPMILKSQRTRMTLKSNFDDEQAIKKIAQECFIVDGNNAQDLVNHLLEEYLDQKVLLQGKCFKYDFMNSLKIKLIQELKEVSQINAVSETYKDVDTLFEPNLMFDNFNETVMTYNIKNTSVETMLTLQKLEDKVKSSEVLFFHLKGCLGSLLYKVYSMVQFLSQTKKLNENIIIFIDQLNENKLNEYKFSLLREKLILEEFKLHQEIDESVLNRFKAQIIRENLMRHYLDRDILRGFFQIINDTDPMGVSMEQLIFENIHLIKQECFKNLGMDIKKSFDQYAELYVLVRQQTYAFRRSTSKTLTQLLKKGESLMPSPSKQVQRSYQQAAAKFQNYYNTREDGFQNKKRLWKIFDMSEDSPWKNLLKGTQQTLSFLGIEVPISPKNKFQRNSIVDDVYYTVKEGRSFSNQKQSTVSTLSKTTENVFYRLHNFKPDQTITDLKQMAQQRREMQNQTEAHKIVDEDASITKLSNFLNQQKKNTSHLLVQAKIKIDNKTNTVVKLKSVDSLKTVNYTGNVYKNLSSSHFSTDISSKFKKPNFFLKRQTIGRINNQISTIGKVDPQKKFSPYLTTEKFTKQ